MVFTHPLWSGLALLHVAVTVFYILRLQRDALHWNEPLARFSHRQISFIKSGLRLAGYCLLGLVSVWVFALLYVSEVVGILEEWNER